MVMALKLTALRTNAVEAYLGQTNAILLTDVLLMFTTDACIYVSWFQSFSYILNQAIHIPGSDILLSMRAIFFPRVVQVDLYSQMVVTGI